MAFTPRLASPLALPHYRLLFHYSVRGYVSRAQSTTCSETNGRWQHIKIDIALSWLVVCTCFSAEPRRLGRISMHHVWPH